MRLRAIAAGAPIARPRAVAPRPPLGERMRRALANVAAGVSALPNPDVKIPNLSPPPPAQPPPPVPAVGFGTGGASGTPATPETVERLTNARVRVVGTDFGDPTVRPARPDVPLVGGGTRARITFYNRGPAPVWLGPAGVTTYSGLRLDPGERRTFQVTSPVFATVEAQAVANVAMDQEA